jgi:G3E family GTPase
MNSAARIYRTKDAILELDRILDVGGFSLDRAFSVDPKFMEPEFPFEWAGVYELETGDHDWVLAAGPDASMNLVVLPLAQASLAALTDRHMDAVLLFSDDETVIAPDDSLTAGEQLYQLDLRTGAAQFRIKVERPGPHAILTEHRQAEYSATLQRSSQVVAPVAQREYKPDHTHDKAVTSVGITMPGDLDAEKLNGWLGELLRTQGQDIFRMKGVLSIHGQDQRFIFQGVHMLFDGRPDRPWGSEARHNSLIFIGGNLDREKLNEEFAKCLV